MNIDINKNYITRGIQFTSYIALNRYMDKRILKSSKLLSLLIYIALRVKRSNNKTSNIWDNVQLNIGEFIIGRLSTVKDTDLTESEYKTRIKQLQTLNIINILEVSNKFTKGKWLENSFIDLNLELPNIQPGNQPTSSGLATNNNVQDPNNLMPVIDQLITDPSIKKSYVLVISEYMKYKGIKLIGYEVKDVFFIVKQMFESQRTPADIIRCMQWFKNHEDSEEFLWIKSWTIRTVQRKLPEFIAGKLNAPTTEELYPYYGSKPEVNK